MELLEKKIIADWIDVRDKMATPVRLKTYLKPDDYGLASLTADLKRSNLDGTVEFKKRTLNGIFSFLSRLSHQTPAQEEILEKEAVLRGLIYILCLQNQFAAGAFRPSKEDSGSAEAEGKPKRIPLDQVIHDVSARLGADPELAKDARVKNILMEVQLYKKEYEQFKIMSPKIPNERAPSFIANFKHRIESILNTIYNHYDELLNQERSETDKELRVGEDEIFQIPGLSKLLLTQVQELSHLRSTINFALQEGHQIRTLLLRLTDKQESVLRLFDEELKLLDARKPEGTPHELAVKLARNTALAVEGNVRKA